VAATNFATPDQKEAPLHDTTEHAGQVAANRIPSELVLYFGSLKRP